MNRISFKEVKGEWEYTLPDGTTGPVNKEIINRYIIPQCHHVYSSQLYLKMDVSVPGFGTHELHLELYHIDQETLDGAYMTIGGREDDACALTTEFELDINEDSE